MDLSTAKRETLKLIARDVARSQLQTAFDEASPDRDKGKFTLAGRPARVIAPFNGFAVNINLDWFRGSVAPPKMAGGEFHYYVFGIPNRGASAITAYFICPYTRMREWVLEFSAPKGRDHRDHGRWRCDIHVQPDGTGIFRWGDEDLPTLPPTRKITLNNVAELLQSSPLPAVTRVPHAAVKYRDFGEAPNDDPGDLQTFARRVRRGQRKLRKKLLSIYGKRCAISGHGPEAVLDAAHILPHRETGLNESDNAILLRSDLHDLFDEGLLRIHPDTLTVWIHPSLQETPYYVFHGRPIRSRLDGSKPSRKHLQERWDKR